MAVQDSTYMLRICCTLHLPQTLHFRLRSLVAYSYTCTVIYMRLALDSNDQSDLC